MAILPNYYYFVPKVKFEDGAAVVELEDRSKADVVEVVRCRDCEYHGNRHTGCSHFRGLITPDSFYCAKGKRREGKEPAP